MTIEKKLEGKKLTVAVIGRMDTKTAPELEQVLDDAYDEMDELVLDMEKLEYTSSAGLRVLLRYHKKMLLKNGMTVTNLCPVVSEALEVTGFTSILTIK